MVRNSFHALGVFIAIAFIVPGSLGGDAPGAALQRWLKLLAPDQSFAPEPATTKPATLAPAVKRAAPAVVTVITLARSSLATFPRSPDLDLASEAPPPALAPLEILSTGSGVLLTEEGHIVTAAHVLPKAEKITVRFGNSTEDTECKVVGSDKPMDIALLQTTTPIPNNIHPAPLGDSDSVEVGDIVLAIGSPYGLDQSISQGIISRSGHYSNEPDKTRTGYYLQTDAEVRSGSSGGALVDSQGCLIGINLARYGEWYDGGGFGLALPINVVRKVVADLAVFGRVKRGTAGLRLAALSQAETLLVFHRTAPAPAQITAIEPGSPAERAGLHSGDVVIAVNGRNEPSFESVMFALRCAQPGDRLQLRVKRDKSEPQDFTLLMADPAAPLASASPPPATDEDQFTWGGGLLVTTLDKAHRLQLEVPIGVMGVLVSATEKLPAVLRQRLQPGTILMSVNGVNLPHVGRAKAELTKVKPNQQAMLKVWHRGVESFIAIRFAPQTTSDTPPASKAP